MKASMHYVHDSRTFGAWMRNAVLSDARPTLIDVDLHDVDLHDVAVLHSGQLRSLFLARRQQGTVIDAVNALLHFLKVKSILFRLLSCRSRSRIHDEPMAKVGRISRWRNKTSACLSAQNDKPGQHASTMRKKRKAE